MVHRIRDASRRARPRVRGAVAGLTTMDRGGLGRAVSGGEISGGWWCSQPLDARAATLLQDAPTAETPPGAAGPRRPPGQLRRRARSTSGLVPVVRVVAHDRLDRGRADAVGSRRLGSRRVAERLVPLRRRECAGRSGPWLGPCDPATPASAAGTTTICPRSTPSDRPGRYLGPVREIG